MIRLKTGVRLLGLRPEMVLAHGIIAAAFAEHGHDCTVSTGIEGTHSPGSEHYAGLALDYRLNDVQPVEHRVVIVTTVRDALGADFDVLHESRGTPNEHLHVEYDPKSPY